MIAASAACSMPKVSAMTASRLPTTRLLFSASLALVLAIPPAAAQEGTGPGEGAPSGTAQPGTASPETVQTNSGSQTPEQGQTESEAAPSAETGPESRTSGGTVQAAGEPQPQREVGADWPQWGGGPGAQRYSPLNGITRDNVGALTKAWEYRTGDMPTEATEGKYSPEGTALKVGHSLYLCSAMNILVALDAETGVELWRYDPEVSPDAIPYGATCRGVTYFENPQAEENEACAARIIEGTLDARLIAVDAKTGEPCEDFGENGAVDLWDGIGERVPGWYSVTAPPALVRGIMVTGAQVKDGQAEDAPSGVIRGYDAVTGELAWAWDLGNPDLSGAPPEGETYTRGTPNMWTTATGDEELGLVYLPMGNSSVDYWGGGRSEAENEYSTSLVALDVTTGKPAWHFQTVRYDVWDYDLGSQVTLVDFPAPNGGGTVPALILPSKQGDIYILNRETGEPLFPVEEIRAPIGGVEPQNLARTQPTSTYHTLRKDRLTAKDMWGVTPLDQLFCRIQFQRAQYDGIYTPPSVDKPWIQYPGYNGGSDWGSIAVDPERGLIIANYNDVPNFNQLIPREKADEMGLKPIDETAPESESGDNAAEGAGDPQAGAPFAIDVNAGWRVPFTGIPCKQPPLGGIRAIDLVTGETVWDQPLGTARRNGPFGIPSFLPKRIGTPNNGGSVVTKGGIVFIAAATDNLIRALDIETGEELWSDVLPAGGQANPTVYEENGREYLLIQAGGHHFMETPIGDWYIAYALPEAEDDTGNP